MAEQKQDELVVPVVSENVHADAVPVETGGVRVVKRIESHDEVLEQELRKGRVEIRRIKTDRIVDGPQPAQRMGNTLVIPVVSEVLRISKEWVVTEEIHVTQLEEREKFEQTVPVHREVADVERFDKEGNVRKETAGEQPLIMAQPVPGEPIATAPPAPPPPFETAPSAAAATTLATPPPPPIPARPLARRASVVAGRDAPNAADDSTVPAAEEAPGRRLLTKQKSILRDRK